MIAGIPVWEACAESRAKARGMKLAGAARYRDLALARQVARELGADGRAVSGDDVRRVLGERHPETLEGNLNYLGAVWERKVWAPSGFVRSRTAGSHGNRLIAWRLR